MKPVDGSQYNNAMYQCDDTDTDIYTIPFDPDDIHNDNDISSYWINSNSVSNNQSQSNSINQRSYCENLNMKTEPVYDEAKFFQKNNNEKISNITGSSVKRVAKPAHMSEEDFQRMIKGEIDYQCGKRGRPRKIRTEDTPKKPLKPNSPNSEKRKRGRPRKLETNTDSQKKAKYFPFNFTSSQENKPPVIVKVESLKESMNLEDIALQVLMEDDVNGKIKTSRKSYKTGNL